jgi:hypothetical protein
MVWIKFIHIYIYVKYMSECRSHWPCGLRRWSAAAHLLGLWVRNPPGASMSVSCECCVLRRAGTSSRGVLPNVVCLKCVIVKSRKLRWLRHPRGCRAIGGRGNMSEQ